MIRPLALAAVLASGVAYIALGQNSPPIVSGPELQTGGQPIIDSSPAIVWHMSPPIVLGPPAEISAPVIPDPSLTPGAVASTDESEVCATVDGMTYSQHHRRTTYEMKEQVFERYGIPVPHGAARRGWEVDHLIPLALGGADTPQNLWPESADTCPGYHDKDRLETRLWERVCREHDMSLAQAQAAFRGDWRVAYRAYVEPTFSCEQSR